MTSRSFPNLVVGHVGVPSDREICDNSMSDLATLSFSSKFCGRKWNYRTEKAIRTQIGPVRVSLIFPSSPKASKSQVKTRYIQKMFLLGVDPVSIPTEQFDPECLPRIEATDLLGYLVLETS